ncbi:MAG: sulfite exporter TauE/SafE family protein [Candidatus Bathyarchaeota archaeon]|nr:sulfite exporter TauE/SafE family protein [Candidatus Bathyarchaeota archaeon]
MLETTVLILAAFIIFIASTVKGLTGFGFALTSLPLLSIFLAPQTAVPLITICSVFLDGYTLYEARKEVQYKEITVLIASGIIGMIIGAYFLVSLETQILKLVIGIVTVLFTIASYMGLRWEITNTKLASIPVGFLSGLLGGAISISGPPIVLFFNNQRVEKKTFRANLIAYFFCLYLATVPAYFYGDLITSELLYSSALLVPVMFIGATLGIRLSRKVDETLFKRIALLLILVTGFMAILTAVGII